jgi:hypothetical protein
VRGRACMVIPLPLAQCGNGNEFLNSNRGVGPESGSGNRKLLGSQSVSQSSFTSVGAQTGIR